MKCIIVITAVLQAVLAGHVSVQMPYLNPAGVTYVTGAAGAHYAAGPLAPVSSAYTTSTYYGNGHFLGRLAAHQHHVAGHQIVAPVLGHHVAAPAAAVVPTVHHVPAVADVPVTRIQAQHGYIQKDVDVAKPAVKTSRFELRRPAIQKQFYDIEERVIVRPAGSALVELDQPHSKVHKSSVVSPLAPTHLAPAHFAPAHFAPTVISASPAPPTFVSPAPPTFIPAGPGFGISSTPSPIDQGISSDDDSVVIEARRQPQPQIQQQEQPQPQEYQVRSRFEQQPQPQEYQIRSRVEQQPQPQEYQIRSRVEQQPQPQEYQIRSRVEQQPQPQEYQIRSRVEQQPQPQEYQIRSRVEQQPIQRTSLPLPSPPAQIAQPQVSSHFQRQYGSQTVVRTSPETRLQDHSGNQQRLIELLTAREGVADVGFGSPSFRDIGDAGSFRARVLSAEVAPKDAPVTGERVNTRRVVVSRPIETIEEVDVLEPVTKLERVAVQHPALFKTAHVGYERVPTSVPVLGKAIAPTVYSQAPIYYH